MPIILLTGWINNFLWSLLLTAQKYWPRWYTINWYNANCLLHSLTCWVTPAENWNVIWWNAFFHCAPCSYLPLMSGMYITLVYLCYFCLIKTLMHISFYVSNNHSMTKMLNLVHITLISTVTLPLYLLHHTYTIQLNPFLQMKDVKTIQCIQSLIFGTSIYIVKILFLWKIKKIILCFWCWHGSNGDDAL